MRHRENLNPLSYGLPIKLTTFLPLQILCNPLLLNCFHHRCIQHFIFDALGSILRDIFLPFVVERLYLVLNLCTQFRFLFDVYLALRYRIRERMPREADGSIALLARAWAVRGTVS
jgi:hypothetical protein